MDHPASGCILPSNAPALAYHGNYLSLRVLQEACGNRGLESEHSPQAIKTDHKLPSENDFAESDRRESRRDQDPTQQEIDEEANRLWRALYRCKAYEKYRSRQPKVPVATQEQKWPDHIEIAFCKGLLTVVSQTIRSSTNEGLQPWSNIHPSDGRR
jgi:hypothetical protein